MDRRAGYLLGAHQDWPLWSRCEVGCRESLRAESSKHERGGVDSETKRNVLC